MTDGIDIGSIDRKARTAGYGDGLLEIFAAVVLGVIALSWLGDPAFVGILAALIAIYGWKVMERVRERLIYPRIGYYRERSDDAKQVSRGMLLFIGGAILVMVLTVLISGGITDASEWRRAAPLLSGIALSGGFMYTATRSGLWRYRIISLWSIVSGILLWWMGTGESYILVAAHLLGLALPLAAIGVWTLTRFLRSHPVKDADSNG